MLKSKKIICGLMVNIFLLIVCSINATYATGSSSQMEENNNTSSSDIQNAETDSTSKSSLSWMQPIKCGEFKAHNPVKHEADSDIEPPLKRTPIAEDNNNEQIHRSPTISNCKRLLEKEVCCSEIPILDDNDEKETCYVTPYSESDKQKKEQIFEEERNEAQKVFETYLHCYMYKFKNHINSFDDYKKEIAELKFKIGESNLDLDLRNYLAQEIKKFHTTFKENKTMKVWYNGTEHTLTEEEIGKISVEKVIAPTETTDLVKYEKGKCQLLKPNARRYVNVDILMILKRDKFNAYVPIEVKSVTSRYKEKSKKYTITGSSLNQIIPNGWLIFVKHPQDSKNFGEVEVAISKYGLAMKEVKPVVKFNPTVSFELAEQAWKIEDDKIILNEQIQRSSTSDILKESDSRMQCVIKKILKSWVENSSECTPTSESYSPIQVSSSLSVGTGCSPIAKISSPRRDESNLNSLLTKVLSGALKELAQYQEEDILKILSKFNNLSSQFD